jgi:hypothetical protein
MEANLCLILDEIFESRHSEPGSLLETEEVLMGPIVCLDGLVCERWNVGFRSFPEVDYWTRTSQRHSRRAVVATPVSR